MDMLENTLRVLSGYMAEIVMEREMRKEECY